MRLFIAEKPSLGRAIAENLGPGQKRNGYIECGQDVVTWCFGHLLEMNPPDAYNPDYKLWKREHLPIVPDSFQVSVKKDCAAQLKIIGELLKKSSAVVNAGDPDREGQLLIDEVLEYHQYTGKCERIWLASLDEKSVQKALATLEDNAGFAALRDAARARSQADWLVGMNCTRAMTLVGREAGAQGVLSLGRVQSPTLTLVVRRDLDIEQFVPQPYSVLQAACKHANGSFVATFQPEETQAGLDSDGRLISKDEAYKIQNAVAGQQGEILEARKERKKKNPPLPYNLSALQKAASAKHGMSAQQVLDIAQSLYEKKLTSYPRSDCRYLPDEQFVDAARILTALGGGGMSAFHALAKNANSSIKGPGWNTKKVTAHHAIIPTGEIPERLTDDEMALYMMIAQSYLIQFYSAQEYEAQKITIKSKDTLWKATGQKILERGWTAFFKAEKEENEEDDQSLPECQTGEEIDVVDIEILSKTTKPPSRFTEGTLIEAMSDVHRFIDDPEAKKTLKENEGIGTEATRANIIETLKKRGFLEAKKKNIISSEMGRQLVKMAPAILTDPVTTAKWESRLSSIATGQESLTDFMSAMTGNVNELVQSIFTLKLDLLPGAYPCPECGRPLTRRQSKKNNKWYWGCFNNDGHQTNEPVFLKDEKGKPVPRAVVPCPECKAPMKSIKTSKGPCMACFNLEAHQSGKPKFFEKQ